MRKVKVYAIFIALTFAVGWTSAALFPPDEWYRTLNKPPFNPPDWVFPIAWSIIYVMVGLAGGRAWVAGLMGVPLLFWITQLGLNGFWSYLFFGLNSPGAALIEVFFFLATIIGFIWSTWKFERTAALLFLPYLAWVSFATVLNAAIWWLN